MCIKILPVTFITLAWLIELFDLFFLEQNAFTFDIKSNISGFLHPDSLHFPWFIMNLPQLAASSLCGKLPSVSAHTM